MRVGKVCHRRTCGLLDWTWKRSRISQAGKEVGYLQAGGRIYGKGGGISEAGSRIS